MALVSVLMPVYNAERYVAEAIQSIINQTFQDFEFIIIDDGSTDNSLSIINKYANVDSRIKVISRENRGLVSSLNEGISYSKGKYIVRMDADDISLEDRVDIQVNFMENHPEIGVCGTWIESFGEDIKQTCHKLSADDSFLKTQLIFSPCFAHPSVIIRKSILIENNIQYNEKYKHIEDYALWVQLARITKFSNIQKVLLRYRISDSNITKVADKDLQHRFKTSKEIFKYSLDLLDIVNNDDEYNIHFTLALNSRIKESKYTPSEIKSYLNKIVSANNKSRVFNKSDLNIVLGKRWLWLCYYKKDPRLFFSRFFFHGIRNLV